MTPQPPKSILSRIKGLNPRQQEAVRYIDGPCLVLAGAGSGKTSVITTKIAYLVQECGMSARKIAAVTFTNKAAREMKERVGQMLKGKEGHGLTVSTFHNLGLNIIRGELKTLGYKPGFSLFDPEDAKALVNISRGFDGGFLTFVLPLILAGGRLSIIYLLLFTRRRVLARRDRGIRDCLIVESE